MEARQNLLEAVAVRIIALAGDGILPVGIDGVDGAGKTTFADELGAILAGSKRPIIRAGTDAFHNPRKIRYRLGVSSPQGFYKDSYNYPLLRRRLLDPLSPGGTRRYRVAGFDHREDAEVECQFETAAPGSILIFDGLFLHRPELRGYWDFSIFLRVDFAVSCPRGAQRGEGSPDPQSPANARYIGGHKIYFGLCEPEKRASLVIDNNDLARPFIVVNP